MKSKKHIVIFILLLTTVVVFSVLKTQAQPDEIETLVRDVSADTQKGAIFGYTYFMKFSYHQHKKIGYGRKFTRLYEAIIPNRFSLKKTYHHPFVLLKDSEKQITNEDIEAMRSGLVEELERAEKEAEENQSERSAINDGGYWTISFSSNGKGINIDILKILENANFSNLQKGEFFGRKVILLDFSPRPDAKFESRLSYLGKIEGRIWIDDADRRIIRIEGFPSGTFEALKGKSDDERLPNAVFLYIQTRVAEGFWFPQNVVVDFTKHPEIFDTVRIEFSFEKYKKSTTEVKSSQLEPPKDVETEEKDQ